ncbi:MAG: 3'-5' DNA helicase [Vezdaea aestivalis]|nr:MAG: 3'-5' DNA helicase [Vezdaea aestivalis]
MSLDLDTAADDEYGDFDEDDLLQAVIEVRQPAIVHPIDADYARPHKRQRVSSGSDDDVFEPSPPAVRRSHKSYSRDAVEDDVIVISSTSKRNAFTASQATKQSTLWGGTVPGTQQSLPFQARAYPLASRDESPTHHELDTEAMKTWVYPINLGTIRDYQYAIVRQGLFHNLLVALPTGLGKTFIAATIMLNWYRWTKSAQIIFVAPTKPLVAQQVGACFGIAGIPRSDTTMMTGEVSQALRDQEWLDKRVFFMTPQTLVSDLKREAADPKRIVLVVVDEAHRATGAYAYAEMIRIIKEQNSSLRILALTATPGSDVEKVQEVIDNLIISRIEIRTEFSIDISKYLHRKDIDVELFDPSDDINSMKGLLSQAIQPVLDVLVGQNVTWSRDPMTLTPFGLTSAKNEWLRSAAGRQANQGLKGMIQSIFTTLASLAHAIVLLNLHGIIPCYHNLRNYETNEGGGKYKKQITSNDKFQKLMDKARAWDNDPNFVGHPKLKYLQDVILNHLMDNGEGARSAAPAAKRQTRIMVFVKFRDSADEVVKVLKRHEPLIRPTIFVGQATSKSGTVGMKQKMQQEIIGRFQGGDFNTLVATSIGEEGLDIGEVDLIVCYDSSASPIQMLQRMGRTGRKRAGNVVLLLMRGKEEDSYAKSKDNYEKMQIMIEKGTRFTFHSGESHRILPRSAQPEVDKRIVEIPVENSQVDLPEPKGKGKLPKRKTAKKPKIPEGVEAGFQKASWISDQFGAGVGKNEGRQAKGAANNESTDWMVCPQMDELALTAAEEKVLQEQYQNVGGDECQFVPHVRIGAYPKLQRSLTPTVHIEHGAMSHCLVKILAKINQMTTAKLNHFQNCLNPEDLGSESEASNADRNSPKKKATKTKASNNSYSTRIRSPSPMENIQDGDPDDGMSDFIVNDDDLLGIPTAKSPKKVSIAGKKKRITLSSQRNRSDDKENFDLESDSDSDLPEIEGMFSGYRAKKPQVEDNLSRDECLSLTQRQRRARPVVLSDSDDEE